MSSFTHRSSLLVAQQCLHSQKSPTRLIDILLTSITFHKEYELHPNLKSDWGFSDGLVDNLAGQVGRVRGANLRNYRSDCGH